jgi:zinc transporter, ZIP family
MLKAILYGLIASSGLLIGAAVAIWLSDLPERRQRTVTKVNKVVMAFGAGVLLCTLSFQLMEEAFQKGGYDHAIVGFLTGALFFILGDLWIDRMGSGWEILFGALLDGIPESAVIGIGLLAGKGLGLIMMIAVFLSNLPEGLSGARDMLSPPGDGSRKYRPGQTIALWGSVTLICALSTVAGYGFFGQSSESAIAFMLAIAAGAILAMVAHTMIPEAFRSLPKRPGAREVAGKGRLRVYDKVEAMAVVAGFLLTFILSHLTK